MKDFLFHKRDDAQPTPIVPETSEVSEAPETLAAPEVAETPVVPEAPETPETPEMPEELREEVSAAYIMEQLALIQKDTEFLRDAMEKITQMKPGDETRAMALSNMVVTREETNQKLISLYSELLLRKNSPKAIKMPSFDGWGKRWSEWGDKVKQTVKAELTPEQDAELKRQIDEAADTLQDATESLKAMAKQGGKAVQHYVNETLTAIRHATYGKVDIRLGDSEPAVLTGSRPKRGSTLDRVTEILKDASLSMEEKELIFDHIAEIRDVDEATQDKVLEIMGDASLSLEEKEMILDHLEDLQELS